MPSRKSKSKDPFARRESANYANPIASREYILQHLEKAGAPLPFEAICQGLRIDGEEQAEALRRRLIAMRRDGQILSNRKGVFGLAAHMDLLKGTVQGTKDGGGFFIPADGSGDLFLSAREMHSVFDGDKVLVRHNGYDRRGRAEGAVVEILERRFTEIVGRYYREQGFGVLVPANKRISQEILIPKKQSAKARDGEFVLAEITEYPSARRQAIARVLEVLGDETTPGLEVEIALRSHDIPFEWPKPLRKELSRFGAEVDRVDFKHRFDLREVPFVTIDGEDAKDFDDAVFAQRNSRGGWTLHVAIADVSHYVEIGSALDEEAAVRGTSVYFPGHVVPMLPEKLSNGLCSLKPGVPRLAMVCEMEISASGELVDYLFYEAVILSHARLTYTEVADMVQPPGTAAAEKIRHKLRTRHGQLISHLDDLHALFGALNGNRARRGALEFESTETRIVFGENKKIREIVPVERNDAHRLIEECMLCANIAAAQLLEGAEVPALYRVHEGPNPDKLENLREFLSELGLNLGGGEKPTPQHYQRVLTAIAGREDRHLLQTVLIRSMMQAVYQPDNVGHFGLGFPAYTHFTSPIRRYPDLTVHRAIRYLIRNKPGPHLQKQRGARRLKQHSIYPYNAADMDSLGESCSAAERRADAASYSVIDWLKCEYMQDHVGDEFQGTVAAVTRFGLFVELANIYIEGLVHITELSNDYYHFDPVRHCLEGERSGQSYRLGDVVQVRVVRVDLDERKIDLEMLGKQREDGAGDSGKRKPRHAAKTDSRENKSRKGNKKTAGATRTRKSVTKKGGGKTQSRSSVTAGKAKRQSKSSTSGGKKKAGSPRKPRKRS